MAKPWSGYHKSFDIYESINPLGWNLPRLVTIGDTNKLYQFKARIKYRNLD